MAKVVLFGILDTASLAHYYLKNDSEHNVVAFTVNEKYLPEEKKFEDLPVVPFEEVESIYPPDDFEFFAPMTYKNMNKSREKIYYQAKDKGYKLISYVSSKATVFPDLIIGDNCFILEDNTIQPFTPIGNNVVMWSGNHIGHHGKIKDHIFFTSHVVLSGHCIVEPFSVFGVNATIKDDLHIAEGTFVGMSSCITTHTKPWSLYTGIPAKKVRGLRPDTDI